MAAPPLHEPYGRHAGGDGLATTSLRRSVAPLPVGCGGGICRTPGCGAAIRHLDHVTAHAQGGRTSAANGQGLCVRCNLVKELLGWQARVVAPHTVEITTPTGHRCSGSATPLVHEDPGISDSPMERALEMALAA
ncbi:MAG TPA: HNH endonuclease signature motif containing protein [Lapillicoccus sp.]|uniref:HNH endonuclease n=1 Tax=Lapillicoccus sp. TaxID=1909287 RepID=UPI002F93B613